MNQYIDMDQYDVIVTFKNGLKVNGSCTGDPLLPTTSHHHGIFDRPFLFLNTCVATAVTRQYDTGYHAMIRTEDIAMIQVKKVVRKVEE